MTNPTAISIPPIFCPTCDTYLGRRPACAACGWERPADQLSTRTPVAAFSHEQPFLAAPLLIPAPVQTDGRALLICGYGRRGDGAGGILALDAGSGALLWQVDLGAAVLGAALAPDGTTLLVGDDDGRLHALHVADGSPSWPAPVTLDSGAIEAAPLLPANRSEPLLTVATAAGVLAQVDWRKGRVVHHFDLGAILGATVRVAASPARRGSDVLVSALETRRGGGGALFVLDAAGRLDVLTRTPVGLYTTPVLAPGGRTAIVGTNSGELLAIDLYSGKVGWSCAAGKTVRATPVVVGGVVYAGSAARRMVAVDMATGRLRWALAWDHSINTPPVAVDELLVFGDSSGCVAAFDLAALEVAAEEKAGAGDLNLHPVWRVDLEADRHGQELGMPTAAVLGGFVVHDGCLWCGSANGRIYRLPLHGHNWAWAEQHARRQARWLDAAACLVWADARQGDRRAAGVLTEHGEHARAAALYAALGSLTEAAQAYEAAAAQSRLPIDWQRAANLWLELKQPRRAQDCYEKAAQMGSRPLLHIECVGISPLKVGEHGLLHVRVTNQGVSRARHLRVELIGADFAPCPGVDCPELTPHSPPLECAFALDAQGAGARLLILVVHAEDEHGNPLPRGEWRETVQVAAADQPPVVQQIYQGPTVMGDGVMILRGEGRRAVIVAAEGQEVDPRG